MRIVRRRLLLPQPRGTGEFTVLFHAMERHTRTIANRGQTPAASISHSSLFFSAHRKLFAKLKGAAAVSRMFML